MSSAPTPLRGLELPLDRVAEYDGAARHYARTGRLPDLMGKPGALNNIQADPEAFYERVRQFQYAQAMERDEYRRLVEGRGA